MNIIFIIYNFIHTIYFVWIFIFLVFIIFVYQSKAFLIAYIVDKLTKEIYSPPIILAKNEEYLYLFEIPYINVIIRFINETIITARFIRFSDIYD